MKLKNIAKILLMTTFLIIIGTKAYAKTGTITEEAAKLRKAPDSKTVLELLEKDSKVEILEQEDGWYKVKATTGIGKVTGYVSEEDINVEKTTNEAPEKPATSIETEKTTEIPAEKPEEKPTEVPETNETISTDVSVQKPQTSNKIEENKQYTIGQVSVKILPVINSREKAKISGNVKVVEIINDWARIENDTENGWIRKNILKNAITTADVVTPETETPQQPEEQPIETVPEETKPEETVPEQTTTKEPEEVVTEQKEPDTSDKTQTSKEPNITELNKVGYVSAEGLRVRKEPTTDSDEIHSLSKNDKVQIKGQTGNWYKIDLDGEIGYVSAKYISDTKVPETTSRSGSTLKDENEAVTEEKQEEAPIVEEKEEPKVEETSVETVQPETTEAPEASTGGTSGAAVVEYAKKYLGYKYVSGGTTPSKGFDCSGFTQYVYKNFGVTLNRTSSGQKNNGEAVEKSNLQPGDIVLFNNDANTKIGHVGIYVGDGNFIHASNPSDGVKITTLLSGYYAKRYVGARRVI